MWGWNRTVLDKSSLPDFDGNTAFGGALRFYDCEDDAWKSEWGKYYGSLIPDIKVFAIDAFGAVYGLSEKYEVVIFWSETGELEPLGVEMNEFYEMIMNDPIGTINLDLYLEAVDRYRKPSFDEHFAFKIETALGGKLTTDNITILNSIEHFKALGKLANRINEIPEGQGIDNISIEQDD